MLFGAPQPGEEPVRHFESRIRPLLIEKCQRCHGEARQRGGLRLDSAKALLAGGEKGPAIESGHPENSLLVKMLKADGKGDLKSMPPDRPLSPGEIHDVELWIRKGAFWPETGMTPDQNPMGEKTSNGGLDSMLVLRKPGGIRPEEKTGGLLWPPKPLSLPKP